MRSKLQPFLVLALIAVASTAIAQPAHLVRDLWPGQDPFADPVDRPAPEQLTVFGNKVVFSTAGALWAHDTATGLTSSLGSLGQTKVLAVTEASLFFSETVDAGGSGMAQLLRTSDGTPGGTRQLPDPSSGATARLTGEHPAAALSQTVLFLADGADGGLRLWKSDGTQAGTTPVAMLKADASTVAEEALVVAGGRAFVTLFRESPPSFELWSSDGTTAGTRLVTTVPITQRPRLLTASSTHVFFVAVTASGEELWASDGTAAGTRAVTSFGPPAAHVTSEWIKTVGSRAYFLADDGARGVELWRSEGTASTTKRLTDFADGAALDALDYPDQVDEVAGHTVFLMATDAFWPEWWTTSGTPASTKRLAAACADCFWDGYPWLRRLGDRLYFDSFSDATGVELWFTDGTPAGTHEVIDLCPGPCSANFLPPVVAGGRLHFVIGLDEWPDRLWSSDGTAGGTRRITSFEGSDTFEASFDGLEVVAVAGRIWFPVNDGVHGPQLWSSEGSEETTTLAVLQGGGAASSDPKGLVAFGGGLLFSACDGGTGEYWVTDGNAAATRAITDDGEDCDFIPSPRERPVVSGAHAFFWNSVGLSSTLWVADGNPGGTRALVTFEDLFGSVAGPVPIPGGVAFFVHEIGGSAERVSLWESDGTPSGTSERFVLAGFGRPKDVWSDGNRVYFTAPSDSLGRQLWWIDVGTGEVQQLTAFPFGNFIASTPLGFSKLGEVIFFIAEGVLWRTDGTLAGTVSVLPDHPIATFAVANGAVYFLTDGYPRLEYTLWRSNGTPAGTVALHTFPVCCVGTAGVAATELAMAALRDRIYFVGDDSEHGRELWSSDGTPVGTHLERDLDPGPASSFPGQLTVAGDRLFFTATDLRHGRELWQIDANADARLVQDVAPEALGSNPAELVATSSALFFRADDGLAGGELWTLSLGGAASCTPSDTALCLADGRFRVEATWVDFAGNTGIAHAAPLSVDTGTFWFFSPTNIEVIIKLLDGQALNGHQWVFYGALSNVEYTLTVTDTQTGATRRYVNPPGRLASVGDTEAFGPRGASASRLVSTSISEATPPALVTERRVASAAKTACVPSATRLCLANGRFSAAVAWKDFAGQTGVGTAAILSSDTGAFWFFSTENIELVVKVLDGRPVTGKFWVFFGALSNVEYTLTVTDTETGTVRAYHNAAGRFASVADTSAF